MTAQLKHRLAGYWPLVLWALPLAWLWWLLINHLRVAWSTNPQYAYGVAVPFLCLYLIWRRAGKAESGGRRTEDRGQRAEGREQSVAQASPPAGSRGVLAAPPSSLVSSLSAGGENRGEVGSLSFDPHPPLPSSIFYLLFVFLALLLVPIRLIQEANPGWRLVSWALALEVIAFTLLMIHLVRGPWSVVRGPWSVVRGPWSVVCGPWSVVLRSAFQYFSVSSFVFPICFFLVAVPWPSGIEAPVIQGLTRLNAAFAIEILGWLKIPALQQGNVIELSTGAVGIDEACSGIRSLQATLMISLFLGEIYALRAARRVLLVLAGFALALVCNLARTLLLCWVAAERGVAAIAGWHDPAGITILVGCFIGLWLVGWRFQGKAEMLKSEGGGRRTEGGGRRTEDGGRRTEDGGRKTEEGGRRAEDGGQAVEVRSPRSEVRSPKSEVRRPRSEVRSLKSEVRSLRGDDGRRRAEDGNLAAPGDPQPSALKPQPPMACSPGFSFSAFQLFSISLLSWLVVVELGVALWYRHVEGARPAQRTWHIAWPPTNAVCRDIPIGHKATELLRYDQARQVQWMETDGTRWQLSWFYWKPGQAAAYLAKSHNPLICMPAGGAQVVSVLPVEFVDVGGLRMPVRVYQFAMGRNAIHVLYSRWEDQAVEQPFGSEGLAGERFNLLRSVWTGRGKQGQRVISLALWTAQDAPGAREQLIRQLQDRLVVEPLR